MTLDQKLYGKSLILRLAYECVTRGIMTDYSEYNSGLALSRGDRAKIERRLGERYQSFLVYRKEVIEQTYANLKRKFSFDVERSKTHVINNPWIVSILEGFERNMTVDQVASIRNIPSDHGL